MILSSWNGNNQPSQIFIYYSFYFKNNIWKKKFGLVSNANTHIDTANNIHHSFLEIFQSFFIKKTINHIVKNNNKNENEVSWKKCSHHSQFHDNKHFGVSSIGRIVALTQMIQRVLKIFDQTKFATHISYFFLIIAVIVVANSGKLVQASIIVAQIAHSDIHKTWAI